MPLVQTRGAASAQGFGEFSQQTAVNWIDDVFSTFLYTGNGTTLAITNGIDLAGKGGLTWIKGRSGATDHALYDTVRGATFDIGSNLTTAQTTQSTGLTAFNSNGFSIGALAKLNTSAATYCSWTFRKQPKFFDVVTYTGNGSNRTISHNLGSVPGMIMVKRTDTTGDWQVYHRSLANTEYLVLNTSDATATGATRWNSTTPTSTEFSLGTDATVNASGGTYVAYIYAHNAGGFGAAGTDNVISCGSFTNSSGAVNLGYEPQYIMYKKSSDAANWTVIDTMRRLPGVSATTAQLYPNASNAESSGYSPFITSTGFQVQGVTSGTYIYMAIRRPMKPPTSGTQVFSPATRTGTGATATVTGVGFAPDFLLNLQRDANGPFFFDKLRGGNLQLRSPLTDAETTGSADTTIAYTNSGYELGADTYGGLNVSGATYSFCSFRRASGFFDEVCYTGDSASNRSLSHNLTVAPELMIVKRRDSTANWIVYSAPTGASNGLFLNLNDSVTGSATFWNSTTPTSSVFSLGSSTQVNDSGGTYVAYLFATLAGVSKVGSYTGTGATQTINCGFTGGARFVLIKRTDSTGDWYVWDTARGMVSGTDPSLLLNSTAAEVNANSIYTATTGFQIVSTAAGINASGGTYIFLAIA